jgi:hypothetical protein
MINGPITARFPLAKNLPAWPTSPSLATGPVTWTRQVLFLKGNLPQEPAYYLFRDTVSGKQPTEWTMWTMSELLGTPAAMANPAQVLTAKPGNTVQPTRELPHSDRYTALGQFDVDMEYYIASPAESPRHTMRWGVRLTNGHNGILEGLGEYQDLLHLRLPGDGTYFIAFYPHKRGTAAPTFTTLGDGTVIKVAGESGTDYGFLSVSPGTATAEAITFTGTCASVQLRNAETTMSLGADGTIKVDLLGISSPAAVSARVTSNQVTLDLPSQHPAQRVTLWTPMALTAPSGVVPCQPNTDGSYTLTVPANMTQVMLKEKISPAPAVRQGKR